MDPVSATWVFLKKKWLVMARTCCPTSGFQNPRNICLHVGGNSEWDSQVKKFTVDVHHNYLSNLISTVCGGVTIASKWHWISFDFRRQKVDMRSHKNCCLNRQLSPKNKWQEQYPRNFPPFGPVASGKSASAKHLIGRLKNVVLTRKELDFGRKISDFGNKKWDASRSVDPRVLRLQAANSNWGPWFLYQTMKITK